jgi:hypothetical protein
MSPEAWQQPLVNTGTVMACTTCPFWALQGTALMCSGVKIIWIYIKTLFLMKEPTSETMDKLCCYNRCASGTFHCMLCMSTGQGQRSGRGRLHAVMCLQGCCAHLLLLLLLWDLLFCSGPSSGSVTKIQVSRLGHVVHTRGLGGRGVHQNTTEPVSSETR